MIMAEQLAMTKFYLTPPTLKRQWIMLNTNTSEENKCLFESN